MQEATHMICAYCDSTFDHLAANQKYCSADCRDAAVYETRWPGRMALRAARAAADERPLRFLPLPWGRCACSREGWLYVEVEGPDEAPARVGPEWCWPCLRTAVHGVDAQKRRVA